MTSTLYTICDIILEHAPQSIWVSNKNGVIKYANKIIPFVSNSSPEMVVGNKIEDMNFIPQEYRDQVLSTIQEIREEPQKYPIEVIADDQSIRYQDLIIKSFRCPTTGATLCTIIIHDVTDSMNIQKQFELLALHLKEQSLSLVKSNKALEEFVYIISHDLKEPLNKVITFADMIEADCEPCKNELKQCKMSQYAEKIQSCSRWMDKLINDLLVYSRSYRPEDLLSYINLNEIVKEVIASREEEIKKNNVSIEIENLPTIECYKTQMHLLFKNLISNSLKFRKKDVNLKISISCERIIEDGEEYCIIKFADNGIGFDEKYKDVVFKIFKRLHGRRDYEGTGIGLAICQKIVTMNRGSIDVISKDGEGTKFFIKLPINNKLSYREI